METSERNRINIEDEMRRSYLDYAMSVIIGRALPDVRDGLKPVHRRILYAMHTEGLHYNRRYSKCAGVVGEVLKKYHPHGDTAVYDALVRLAHTLDTVLLLSAVVGKLPNDLVVTIGRRFVGKAAAGEAYRLS